MSIKKIAVTFSGGSYSLKLSQLRLEQQLKAHFDGIASFDENSPLVKQLMHMHPQVFQYRRGFGYWAWKPFVIYAALQHVNEGDFVFYIDCGNDIVSEPSPLFNLCRENNGFLIFENRNGNPNGEIWVNSQWTKIDCFNKMNCAGEKYYNGKQVDAAYQLYQKNSRTIDFINEYLKYCLDPAIVTDEPNVTGSNLPDFIAHRHDQSVLSLLSIKHEIRTFPEPSQMGNCVSEKRLSCGYGQIFFHHRGTVCGRR